MLAFRKNKTSLIRVAVLAAGLGLMVSPAVATIVIEYGVSGYGYGLSMGGGGRTMPSLVVVPPQAGSQAGYLMNRSRSWYTYGRQNGSSVPLVVAPMTGMSGDVSERQWRARGHVGRANAYRLRYYDR